MKLESITRGFVLSICLACASTFAATEPDSPEAELASFQIADGFEVNLFASETNGAAKPIQIRFDSRGRLWVVGSTVYPLIEPGQKPNDKVVVFEDTNRDGRADKSTIFADGLMIPTGIETVENGCYVGHGTELLFLKDENGDGRADRREVVLRGFGTGDNHQNINSFRWGPGGELFFCQGLHIRSHVETPWGISSLEEAGLWRLRPRLLQLHGFYGSANEPQNPWGWVFTDWGEPIVIAGNNSSHIYPVPGMVVNRKTEAPPQIWKDGKGRKCSNGDIVGTAHFPESWQGALIVGGYINNAVWSLKISPDGAGFALDDLPPLITSTNRSFRPVDAKFGPDGALYIADWYNPIIGHYQASFRHPDRDKSRGRIWRVTAKGRPLTPAPALAGAAIPKLLDALKSPDRWTRQFAKRVLSERPTDAVVAGLRQWTAQPNLSEHALTEALGVYQSHETPAPELLAMLSRASDPNARAYAASVAGAWAGRLSNPLELLEALARDEHPRVRMQAIVACTYVESPRAIEAAAAAADFPADRFLQYAWSQAVHALKPHWLPELRAGRLNLGTNAARWTMLVRADGTADTVQSVRALLRAPGASSAESLWRILAETGDANDFAQILQINDEALKARVLPALRVAARSRQLKPSGDVAALLQPLVESDSPEIRAESLRLAGLWQVDSFRQIAASFALRPSAPGEIRRAAVEALGSLGAPPDLDLLARLAAAEVEPGVRSAAIVALAPSDLNGAAKHAALALASLNNEHATREIVTAFLQRQSGAAALVDAFGQSAPSARNSEIALEVMNASGRRDEQLAGVLTAAAGQRANSTTLTGPALAAFINEVKTRGNGLRGGEVFRNAQLGCVPCHRVNGEGGIIGPDLSAVGSAQPVDFIVGAILEPQKEVKEGFTAIAVTTKDGDDYQGYAVRETGDELVLRDSLQNQEVSIRKNNIEDRRTVGSVMPPGLADTLSREDFRDLVRYLSDLGKQH